MKEEPIEEKIERIKRPFEEECGFWCEVFIQSMCENKEAAYIAKIIYCNVKSGKYQNIYFHPTNTETMMNDIQADAAGNTIYEAINNLLEHINIYFYSSDYNIVIKDQDKLS